VSETTEWVRRVLRSLADPRRFTQFLSIGALGAVVDNVVLWLVVQLGPLTPTPGAVVSKECAILVMFLLNEQYTFSGFVDGGFRATVGRLVRSNVVRSGGAAVGIGVLHLLTTQFGVWFIAANVVGIGVGFVFNYVFESIVTWRISRTE
jgi:putative flippase GtrA